ncbi:MAG: TPM domain-containing protein [Bacteroidetes bacterium]|nr:TPM domain-containing protein [Bacteroidota bacterium]
MKQFLIILCSILSITLVNAQDILPKPSQPSLVTDMANVLSPEQKQILEQKLVAIDDSSSNQIAIVLIKTLNDYPIEEYAIKLFRSWGIGSKKTNNGVLIIAAIDDHKIRIEVGYGLEGAIPDITTASIIRNDIAPYFKVRDYYHGLDLATNSIAQAAIGEYKIKKAKKGKDDGGSALLFLGILIVVFLIVGSSRGGGGSTMSRSGAGNIAQTLFWASLLSGGGGSRGGGGFGGDDSGGGFGGFDGGSSGGGGASGSW